MFSGVGIVIALGALVLLLAALMRRGRQPGLGSVSRTWVIENRPDNRGRG